MEENLWQLIFQYLSYIYIGTMDPNRHLPVQS